MYEISKKISIGIERYTSYSTKCLDRKREGAMCMKVREEASGPCISRPSILHDPKQHQIKHGWKVIYCYKLTNQLEKRVILQEHSRYYLQLCITLWGEVIQDVAMKSYSTAQSLVQTNNKRCHQYHSRDSDVRNLNLRCFTSWPSVSHGWSQLFELGKGHQSYPFLNSLMENINTYICHICISFLLSWIYNSNYTNIYLWCLILTVQTCFTLYLLWTWEESTDNATDFRYDLSCICIWRRDRSNGFMIVESAKIILGLQSGTWDVPGLWQILVDLSVTTKQLKHVSIL